eukprot:TRINITY_DN12587_c0_g1_i1.p1 TRINITY_DN12587_c0_g1~~TRINITY_DN12587_c0_g1_i1.p1  ORF type:complete len:133 (-),score=1.97 TRINITY_DN12587_c0_g1_i1:16-414(-)
MSSFVNPSVDYFSPGWTMQQEKQRIRHLMGDARDALADASFNSYNDALELMSYIQLESFQQSPKPGFRDIAQRETVHTCPITCQQGLQDITKGSCARKERRWRSANVALAVLLNAAARQYHLAILQTKPELT